MRDKCICYKFKGHYATVWLARWRNGWRVGPRIKRSTFEPLTGHCVVFLGKTLYSHSASLHKMGTGQWISMLSATEIGISSESPILNENKAIFDLL